MNLNEKAIEAIEKAIEIEPKNSKLYFYNGLSFYKAEKFDKAVDAFKKAIELEQENAEYHFNLATAYDKLGNMEDTVKP